jgi:hypothetical protein
MTMSVPVLSEARSERTSLRWVRFINVFIGERLSAGRRASMQYCAI